MLQCLYVPDTRNWEFGIFISQGFPIKKGRLDKTLRYCIKASHREYRSRRVNTSSALPQLPGHLTRDCKETHLSAWDWWSHGHQFSGIWEITDPNTLNTEQQDLLACLCLAQWCLPSISQSSVNAGRAGWCLLCWVSRHSPGGSASLI